MRLFSAIALAALCASFGPVHAQSNRERQDLLRACKLIAVKYPKYESKCERVVQDGSIPLNTLRICGQVVNYWYARYTHASTTWEQLRALPHAPECWHALQRAGVALNARQ